MDKRQAEVKSECLRLWKVWRICCGCGLQGPVYMYMYVFVGYIRICGLVCVSQIPNNIRKAHNDPEHKKVLEEFWKVQAFRCVLNVHMCVCILTCVCVCMCVCVCVCVCAGLTLRSFTSLYY